MFARSHPGEGIGPGGDVFEGLADLAFMDASVHALEGERALSVDGERDGVSVILGTVETRQREPVSVRLVVIYYLCRELEGVVDHAQLLGA